MKNEAGILSAVRGVSRNLLFRKFSGNNTVQEYTNRSFRYSAGQISHHTLMKYLYEIALTWGKPIIDLYCLDPGSVLSNWQMFIKLNYNHSNSINFLDKVQLSYGNTPIIGATTADISVSTGIGNLYWNFPGSSGGLGTDLVVPIAIYQDNFQIVNFQIVARSSTTSHGVFPRLVPVELLKFYVITYRYKYGKLLPSKTYRAHPVLSIIP